MNKSLFTIIVPCQKITLLITNHLIPALKKQSLKDFQLLLVPDQKPTSPPPLPAFTTIIPHPTPPGQKRNFAAQKTTSPYLAFIDSDAYPHPHWLKNATQQLKKTQISAVCGPNLTPPQNNLLQQISGLVWSTPLGAQGAGTYRNSIQKKRFVTDFPTSNLIVKNKAFQQIKGFDPNHWPGEDTQLCLKLTQSQHSILYHPDIRVFHHRRPVFIPHLHQISRFGFHRGLFSLQYPQTSLKLDYFIPLLFTLYLISIFPTLISTSLSPLLTLSPLLVYLLLLTLTCLHQTIKHRHPLIFPLLFLAIPATHLTYAFFFLKGLLSFFTSTNEGSTLYHG